jgi:sensor histidine kinase regulating citrate/malate metabolism
VSDSDLCVILGNALDNAIEACGKMDNPMDRFIAVEVRNMKGQLLVKIQNSYNGVLNRRGNNYYSTKNSPNHGIGLGNIHKVADAYGGFVRIEHNAAVFTLMAAFPNPQENKEEQIRMSGSIVAK